MDPHFWLKEDCIYVTNTSSATTPTPTTTKPVYFRGNYILQGIVQKVFQLIDERWHHEQIIIVIIIDIG